MSQNLLFALPVAAAALWIGVAVWLRHRRSRPVPPPGWPRESTDPAPDWDPPTLDPIAAVVCPGVETRRVQPAPNPRCRCGYAARAWSIRSTGRVHIEHILRTIGDCVARVCPGDCGGLATADGDPCSEACAHAAAAANRAVGR